MSNGNLKVPESTEEAREWGRRGGRASGEARRRKKSMKERLLLLMETKYGDMEGADGIACALFERALGGDVRAIEQVLALVGESPKQTIKVALPRDMAASSSLPGITAAVLGAVAKGRISPEDGTRLAGIVTAHARAVELGELAARVEALEARGDHR